MRATRFITFLFFCGITAQASADTIKASVNGMVCAFCAQGIEHSLRATGASKDIYINLNRKVVAMELKEGASLAHDKFVAIVKDAGYDVTAIETVKLSAADVRAAYKK
jgi:cation transport ATPase